MLRARFGDIWSDRSAHIELEFGPAPKSAVSIAVLVSIWAMNARQEQGTNKAVVVRRAL